MSPRKPLLILPLLALTACATSPARPSIEQLRQRPLVYIESMTTEIDLSPSSDRASNRTTVALAINEHMIAENPPEFLVLRVHSVTVDETHVTLIGTSAQEQSASSAFRRTASPSSPQNPISPASIADAIASSTSLTLKGSFTTTNVPGATGPERITIEGDITLARPASIATDTLLFDEQTNAHQPVPNLTVRRSVDEQRMSQAIFVEYEFDDLNLENVPVRMELIDANGIELTSAGSLRANHRTESTIRWIHNGSINRDAESVRQSPSGVRISRATKIEWVEIPFVIRFNAKGKHAQTTTTLDLE